MSATVFVLNGPNLNMLGIREPGIYGAKTLEEIEADCHSAGECLNLDIDFRQSNHEGDMIDWIQEAGMEAQGLVLNPGAYTHSSIATHDALRAIPPMPVIEIHLSNIHAREAFRHRSMVSPVATAVICGLGPQGYAVALEAISARLQDQVE